MSFRKCFWKEDGRDWLNIRVEKDWVEVFVGLVKEVVGVELRGCERGGFLWLVLGLLYRLVWGRGNKGGCERKWGKDVRDF